MADAGVLRSEETAGVGPAGTGTFGRGLDVQLGRGVADLVRRLGDRAITVEITLDFDCLVTKQAVAFPGPSEPSFGFRCVRVEGVDVWWRQRLLLAGGRCAVSAQLRPRRIAVWRVGRALSAAVEYA